MEDNNKVEAKEKKMEEETEKVKVVEKIGNKEKEKSLDKIVEKKESGKEVKKLKDYKSGEKPKIKDDLDNKSRKDSKDKAENKKSETDKAKKEEKPKIKKASAIAKGSSLHISKKQGMYICKFIKGKKIDDAIKDLERVILYKKAVPFKGEIPHRKGKGMMSGRYPIKASGLFIKMLKSLKGNSIVNGLELEKTLVFNASASWASRPAKKGNRNAKRTNVILESREVGGNK